MATVEPLMSHFSAEQRRKVIEANYLSLAMKAFSVVTSRRGGISIGM